MQRSDSNSNGRFWTSQVVTASTTSLQFDSFVRFERSWLPVVLTLLCQCDFRLFRNIPGVLSLVIAELAVYICLGIAFLDAVVFSIRGYSAILLRKEVKWLLLYILWCGLVSLLGYRFFGDYTLARYKEMFPSALVFVLIVLYVRDARTVRRVVVTYFVGYLLNAWLGVSQALFDWPYPVELSTTARAKLGFDGELVVQGLAIGLFAHPIALAMSLLPGTIAAAALVVMPKFSIGHRVVGLLVIGVGAYVLSHTYSKGIFAWLSWGIGCLFVQRFTRWRSLLLYAGGMVAMIGVVLAVGMVNVEEIRGMSTILGRWNQWERTVELFFHQPMVLLIGNGSSDLVHNSLRQISSFVYPNAHNAYLNQVLFYGVPGIVLWLAWIWKTLSAANTMNSRVDVEADSFNIALYIGWLALLGESFFEPFLEGVALQAQLYSLIAIYLCLAKYGLSELRGQDQGLDASTRRVSYHGALDRRALLGRAVPT